MKKTTLFTILMILLVISSVSVCAKRYKIRYNPAGVGDYHFEYDSTSGKWYYTDDDYTSEVEFSHGVYIFRRANKQYGCFNR